MGDHGESHESFQSFAASYENEGIRVTQASVISDERQDGEPVTRVLLLVNDPEEDTWDVEQIQELRRDLGVRANELGVAPLSVTLVAESEAEEVEAFAS